MFPACVLLKRCWQLITRGMHRGWSLNSLCSMHAYLGQEDGSLDDRLAAAVNVAAGGIAGDGLSGHGDNDVYPMNTLKANSYSPSQQASYSPSQQARSDQPYCRRLCLGNEELALTLLRGHCK